MKFSEYGHSSLETRTMANKTELARSIKVSGDHSPKLRVWKDEGELEGVDREFGNFLEI